MIDVSQSPQGESGMDYIKDTYDAIFDYIDWCIIHKQQIELLNKCINADPENFKTGSSSQDR